MKPTQRKDALRNIGKEKVSYLSIVVIAFLGVTAFLGIGYSAVAMQSNGSDMYNEQGYRDLEVIATQLLTAEDIECLRNLEGVNDVEPLWQADANVYADERAIDITALTVTERMNRPLIREGRLPETTEECALETKLAEELGYRVGDVIEWLEMTDSAGQYFLSTGPLTITGIVDHPDHISLNVPEKQYMLFVREAFDHAALKGCSMKALVDVDAPADRFGQAYDDSLARVTARIETLSRERIALRDEQVFAETVAQIEEILTEGEKGLSDSRKRLDEDTLLVAEQEQALSEVERSLQDTKKQLDDVPQQMRTTQSYIDSLAAYEQSVQDLEAKKRDLAAYKEEIRGAEEGYADGLKVLDALAKRRDALVSHEETLESGRWILLTCKGNASFSQLQYVNVNLSSLQMSFSLLFVIIGGLVIYATVSKMVDEQRTQVGITKALGFFNQEVFVKYLFFGLTATALGTFLGILTAYFGLEQFVLQRYKPYFSVDLSRAQIALGPTLVVLLGSLLLAVCAVSFACLRQIRTPSIQLLQPPVPKTRKRAARGGKHLLSLFSRLVLRNVRTDVKRVLVTVASVAGCCTLVVIGFTLRNAIVQGAANQYIKVLNYDGRIRYSFGEDVEKLLQDAGVTYVPASMGNVTFQITEMDAANLYCGDIAAISDMFRLNDWKTDQPLTPTDEGIFIQKRMAEVYGLDVGSEFELSLGALKPTTVRVAGIFNNYAGRPMFMTPAYYEATFQQPPENNIFYVRFGSADREKTLERIRATLGFSSYTSTEDDGHIFDDATSVINVTVAMLLFMAALMAGMVQLNLTNIYILQKKREMTVMRINGFTTREVIAYVSRETVFTTAVGILLGLAVGSFLGYRIVRALEPSFIQLERSLCYPAWGYAAALTVLFTVIINILALRKVKNLKLTDVA